MKNKNRLMRFIVALAVAGIVAAQIPNTEKVAFAAGSYTNTGSDSSGNFLGISGISNRDAIQVGVLGVAAYGIYEATTGHTGSGDIPPAAPKSSPSPSPSPAVEAPAAGASGS